jgi:hypothetical protein
MINAIRALIVELRDDAAVGAVVGTRVRGPVPAAGDALGEGHYQPFILVAAEGGGPDRRVPVQRPRVLIKCYGIGPTDAYELYVKASTALHERRGRAYGTGANRIWIWNSWDVSGGSAEADPRTAQPYVSFIVELIATSQAVAA